MQKNKLLMKLKILQPHNSIILKTKWKKKKSHHMAQQHLQKV